MPGRCDGISPLLPEFLGLAFPHIGWAAVVVGALLVLWRDGDSLLTMLFRMTYTGIRVKDMEESLRFYTEILGMQVIEPLESTPTTEGKVVTLRSPSSTQLLELNWYAAGSRFGPAYSNGEDLDHLAFECDDLTDAVAELARRGIEVVFRLKEIGGWNEAFVKDPNGIWIELLQSRQKPTVPG